METLLRDLNYGLRMLLRKPSVSALAVLALALGIGANSAIFSVVYAVLLRPLPVAEAARVVAIQAYNPRMNIPPISPGYSSYGAWKRQASSFSEMAASWAGTGECSTGSTSETVPFWRVTATFFPLLGVQPILGRAFSTAEDTPGAPKVALLAYEFWQARFGSDPAVAGKTLRMNGELYTILGVTPRGFHLDGKPAAVYAPIAQDPADRKKYLPVTAYARLKPGVTVSQAQQEMDAIAKRLDERRSGWMAQVSTLRDSLVRDMRLSLLVLLGAVTLVLLIACANIASLLLARSGARRREMAIRVALGGRGKRLMAQLLSESALLGVFGGAAGLLLAVWSMRLVPLLEDPRLPNLLLATRIDGAVLAFTTLISIGTGLLFGLAPALSALAGDVHNSLKEGGRLAGNLRQKRMWNTLVVTETGLAVMLLIGATLLMRNFFYLRDTAPGFRVDGLLTLPVTAPPNGDRLGFYEQQMAKVRSVPGVAAATLATSLPLDGDFRAMSMPLEGHTYTRPQEWPVLWHRTVEEDYFRTLEIPLRRGRVFDARDRDGAERVAIINESMARRFWPGADPVGKHMGAGREYFTIVGIVADVRHQNATKEGLVEVFFPFRQAPPPAMSLAVRVDRKAARRPLVLAASIGRALESTVRIKDLLQIASDRLAPQRLTMAVIATFAGLALLLAAIGIYGVLSFTVSGRTHEIGIRMALGAPRTAVIRMIVREAATLAGAGVLLGIAGALALSRVLAGLLYGAKAADPLVFATVAGVLLAVAVLAAYIPARHAARIDPVTALRDE